MSHGVFEGSAAAVITPMNRYGNLDSGAFGGPLERMIRGGTDAVVVNDTTGESATLDDKEKMVIIRYAVRQVDDRILVIMGMGSNRTEHAVELSRKVQELGADALLQVIPCYDRASQEGLMCHFTQVANHVSIPTLLYNVPSRTGVTTQPGTYRTLSEHPNIQETKKVNGNLSLITRTVALCGQRFDIYSDNDDQTVSIMSLDGEGVVSVLTNIMPKEMHKMCRLYPDGDVKESRRMQFQLLGVMEAPFWDVNPIPVKTVLGLMGVYGNDLCLPLTPMEPEQRERLAEVMKRQGTNLEKKLYNQTNLL